MSLCHQESGQRPSLVQEILGDAAEELNLVAGFDLEPLEDFSTGFTELSYCGGNRKAYLMTAARLESKYVLGRAVGTSGNRKLAMHCWEHVRKRMRNLRKELGEEVIYHDLDSVYTS